MIREFSPQATAYAVRCKPDAIRDWRRLGLLNGLSERKGKGHLFTVSDVARIAVAAFIARNGATLRQAFEIVDRRGAIIDTVAATERNAPGAGQDYVLTFVVDPDVSFPASITNAPISNIEFDAEPIGALQINVSRLVRSALERLVTYDKWDAGAAA
ncbi:hypothetical protein [Bradyrhizobium sp. CCBAU 53340]|uniref:hypothetical protein n=1 Tax=Bradyrhizobium sp. CCBAU 53340 TaxID=1325112 RepID=UPI00188A1208|nr:hypothetical protein [Bradyrhizobium sp. CCBAU 53340]